jgi:hypothetical protein
VRTGVAVAALAVATGLAALVGSGRLALGPGEPGETGTPFYVVPYHYGFVFYDADLVERSRIEVRVGETVTLYIVPAQALPRKTFLAYNERTLGIAVGGLPAGDPRIGAKIAEDLALGNVEHIIGVGAHPVYVTTEVTRLLGGRPFRLGGPTTLQEAIRRGDPAIRSATFTAKRVGAFDVLCVDSGMDGAGTCGWGHKWMVAKGALVVRP